MQAYRRPAAFNGDRMLTSLPTVGARLLAEYDVQHRSCWHVRFLPDRRHFLLWTGLYEANDRLFISMFRVGRPSALAVVEVDDAFRRQQEWYHDHVYGDK